MATEYTGARNHVREWVCSRFKRPLFRPVLVKEVVGLLRLPRFLRNAIRLIGGRRTVARRRLRQRRARRLGLESRRLRLAAEHLVPGPTRKAECRRLHWRAVRRIRGPGGLL